MGRRIPWADHLSVHPTALSLSLLLAGIAAGIAISTTTTLCIARFRKRSKQKPSMMSPPNKIPENLPATLITTSETLLTMPRLSAVESEAGPKEDDAPIQIKKLPLPPAVQLRATCSCNNLMTKSASTRSRMKVKKMSSMFTMGKETESQHTIQGPPPTTTSISFSRQNSSDRSAISFFLLETQEAIT